MGNQKTYAPSEEETGEPVRSAVGTKTVCEDSGGNPMEGREPTIEELMVSSPPSHRVLTRRALFKAAVCGFAGLAVYGVEMDRHWLETTHYDVHLPGLPADFDGFRAVQLSDIHIDEFTEPFFLRDAVDHINRLAPDAVFLTGDFVTYQLVTRKFARGSAWQCANILSRIKCPQRYAIFGNHDVMVSENVVGAALKDNGITVLRNWHIPLERSNGRLWLAGVDDPVEGRPDPEAAIPARIRNRPNEPVILLCHAPDYANTLLKHPAGQTVSLMLCGHTHGGQVRIPFMPPVHLPPLGRIYVEGWFKLGSMRLFVNRGLGTVGVPVRFNCAPELTVFTLRAGPLPASGS